MLPLKYPHKEIDFLDLIINKDAGRITTATYFKSVDTNSYLDFGGGHLQQWKTNVPFGQYRLVRKNCTIDTTFKKQAKVLQKRFLDKEYPISLTTQSYNKGKTYIQECFLREKNKRTDDERTRINFITTYHMAYSEIKKILSQHWYIKILF